MLLLVNLKGGRERVKRYYRAVKLRQEGKTLREISSIMGFSPENARQYVRRYNIILRQQKKIPKYIQKIINES